MSCFTKSILAYLRRHTTDTNPKIMEAVNDKGEPESHWFYMSSEVVSTSEFVVSGEMKNPYEGPLDELPADSREYLSRGVEYEFGNIRARRLAIDAEERDKFFMAADQILSPR